MLLCGILLLLRFSGLVALALLGSGTRSSWTFLSLFFRCSLSFALPRSLVFSLSLCFLDFFLDLLFKEAGQSWATFRMVCPGEDVLMLEVDIVADPKERDGVWQSLSTVSWESQSRPLWLESLLTSESASNGRGMSNAGSGWELDVTPVSGTETDPPDWAAPASAFPLDEPSLPFTGAVAALLVRCDILGFLLTRGSMKSAAGRFW